jgi:SAM-dependent methyltransferase
VASTNASGTVDLYDTTYAKFQERVREQIRRETYGEDIVQNSWLMADEFREFFDWMELSHSSTVLEVAVGSGGPALFMARTTGAQVVGVDINEHGISAANDMARAQQLDSRVRFECADASQSLPFEDGTFDAIICNDSINHLPG